MGSQNVEGRTILRSDEPAPLLELIDLSDDANDEFVAYTNYAPVRAVLTGLLGKAQLEINMKFDELFALQGRLENLCRGDTEAIEWQTWDQQIRLDMHLVKESFGPPVLCKATLANPFPDRGVRSSAEEYECAFYTNLSWIQIFLSGLARLINRYEQARNIPI